MREKKEVIDFLNKYVLGKEVQFNLKSNLDETLIKQIII